MPLAEDRRIGQQPLRLALEQLAEVGPRRRRARPSPAAPGHCGSCRWRAPRPAGALAGRHEDGVVADGGERRAGRPLRLGERAPEATEHAGQDAEGDGRLEVAPVAEAAREQPPQRAQGGDLVLVLPERLEQRRMLLVGRADRLRCERADLLDRRQAVAPGERGVGDERRSAGRAVDQRHRLARVLHGARRERAEEVPERDDLPAAAIALRRHGGQRVALEHPRRPRARALAGRRSCPRSSRSGGPGRCPARRAPAAARRRTRPSARACARALVAARRRSASPLHRPRSW